MRNYEITIVLPGKATSAKTKEVVERFGKLVSASGGKITNTEEWGKKTLAYEIKKNAEGVFVYFDVEMPAEGVKNIKDKLKLEDDIIRYLIIVKG